VVALDAETGRELWRFDPAGGSATRARFRHRGVAVHDDPVLFTHRNYLYALDKRTGARDVGFGLHIMDFLMAPGWRDDGYPRDAKVHGDLPKHYVEGPQICTQAKELKPEVVKGNDFVAIKLRYTFNKPGQGYKAGSTWEQTLVFKPGLRYFLSAERITLQFMPPSPIQCRGPR